MVPTKIHPETRETLYPSRRVDGSAAQSAYVWESLDGRTQLDPTPEEDQAIHYHFDTDRTITGR